MQPPARHVRNRPTVVLAGGGVAALEAMLALRELVGSAVRIQLVSPEPHFWYRPLAVAEPFQPAAAIRFPLVELAGDADAEVVPGAVAAVEEATVRLDRGATLAFDALLLATGTRSVAAVPGALTFRGPADTEAYAALLEEAAAGAAKSIVFASPSGPTWQLPLYELALLTHDALVRRGVRDRVGLRLVTPEDTPLHAFGPEASAEVSRLLDERSIDVLVGRHPQDFADGVLRLRPRLSIPAGRVVALPRLEGVPPEGVARDRHGFVPVDDYGRVRALHRVYAAGDVTAGPIKQGGLAAQQADAAASAIAADLGFDVDPEPFRPVLRGLLVTGGVPRYLRAEVGRPGAEVGSEPLWWPPSKISARRLARDLAARQVRADLARRR